MNTSNKILIKEKISENLSLRDFARTFFIQLNKSTYDSLIIDFKGVNFMSRSFAQEYLDRKTESEKQIKEINMLSDIEKMFEVVKAPRERKPFFDFNKLKITTL